MTEIIRDASYKKPKTIVSYIHSSDTNKRMIGHALIMNLEELGFRLLFDSLPPDNRDDLVWDLDWLTELQLENQSIFVKKLEKLFDDKRSVTVPQLPPNSEERYPPKRVCDEAYLMLRKMTSLEGSEGLSDNSRTFLYHMSEIERDCRS